jgi:hypothetical protein
MNRLAAAAVSVYAFLAGDPVILIGAAFAFGAVAALLHGTRVAGTAAGVALVLAVAATLAVSLVRERGPRSTG